MTFRSTHGFLLTACTLLVPLVLSCSSEGGGGDENRGPPPYNQANNPSQPSPTPEAPAPEGNGDDPEAPAPTGNGEGLPGSIPVAEGQTPATPMTGTAPEAPPVTPETPVVMTPPVTPPVATTGYPENTGAECNVTAAPLRRNDNLPDPFAMHDGTRISTQAQWECRRNEIKKDIEQFEIGTKPEPPTVNASFANNQLRVVVTTNAGSITLSSNVSGVGARCVAIGMNSTSSLIQGCVQVPFMHNQVVTYNQNSNVNLNDPFYTVYPELRNRISNYAAWSWGISRIIDGLDQVKDQLNIDMAKIGVHGCSYAGKMALFGGAFDERVALTLAQESGGGGINSWRLSQNFTTRTGTNIEKIDNTNYSWFLPSMRTLDPYSLPHDHHELIAMIAPRAFVTFGNRDYEWLGDESGYKSVRAAQEVWKALGVEANIGFDFTTGHPHCQAAQSQVNTANAFVNRFLKDQNANTAIAIQPPANGFDLNQAAVINWTTPTLQ